MGIIRLVLENEIRVPLRSIFKVALDNYRESPQASSLIRELNESKLNELSEDLLLFFSERLKIYLRDKGVRHDVIEAVIAAGNQEDLSIIVKRIHAVEECLVTSEGSNFVAGIKRAENILRIEEKKDKRAYNGAIDPELLSVKEEKLLYAAINRLAEVTRQAVLNENFMAAMLSLSVLRVPIDAFFDCVVVNTQDASVRENRLNLLSTARILAGDIADFTVISGGDN